MVIHHFQYLEEKKLRENTFIHGYQLLWFRKKMLVHFLIHVFDNSILEKMHWKFPFCWQPNFVVYKIHETKKIMKIPTNNNTFTIVNS